MGLFSLFSPKIWATSGKFFEAFPNLQKVGPKLADIAQNMKGSAEKMLTMGAAGDPKILKALEIVLGDAQKARMVYDELRAIKPGAFTEQERKNLITFLESSIFGGKYNETAISIANTTGGIFGALNALSGGSFLKGGIGLGVVGGLLAVDVSSLIIAGSAVASGGLTPLFGIGAGIGAASSFAIKGFSSSGIGIKGAVSGLESLSSLARNPVAATTIAYPALAFRGMDLSQLHTKDNSTNIQLNMHYKLQQKKGL